MTSKNISKFAGILCFITYKSKAKENGRMQSIKQTGIISHNNKDEIILDVNNTGYLLKIKNKNIVKCENI